MIEERQRLEELRERVEGPGSAQREDSAACLLEILLARLVGDVLPDAFLATTREADQGRLAKECA